MLPLRRFPIRMRIDRFPWTFLVSYGQVGRTVGGPSAQSRASRKAQSCKSTKVKRSGQLALSRPATGLLETRSCERLLRQRREARQTDEGATWSPPAGRPAQGGSARDKRGDARLLKEVGTVCHLHACITPSRGRCRCKIHKGAASLRAVAVRALVSRRMHDAAGSPRKRGWQGWRSRRRRPSHRAWRQKRCVRAPSIRPVE